MKFTTIRLLLSLTLIITLFSCSKSNNAGSTPPPTVADSLFSWKIIGSITASAGINDIWFTSPSKGFAAVTDGNLYQTQDSGKTWSKIANTLVSSGGMSNLFFAGSQYGFAQSATQMQITKDGGNTWTLKTFPTTEVLNIFFTSPSTGYYGDIDSGMYKTTDTGLTWKRTFRSTKAAVDYPISFTDPDHGFIVCGDGIVSGTVDGAASWQQVQQNIFTPTGALPTFNTLQFVDNLNGYFAHQDGVLKTTDGGSTWKSVYPSGGYINVVKFFDASNGYFKADSAIYKTTNGAQTWTPSLKLASGDIIISMFFLDSTTGWACTGKGAVLRIDHQ